MPDTARTRTGLRAPAGATDTLDTYDNTVATAFDLLEANIAIDGQGLLAARPPSTSPSPGKRGRYYFATDTRQAFRDNGTGWDEIVVVPAAAQAWQTIALPGTAGRFSGTLAYYKDPVGVVRIRPDKFTVVGGGSYATGAVIATLPAGYRPGVTSAFVLHSDGSPPDFYPVTVTAGGAITVLATSIPGGASGVSFEQITFRAEN